MKMIGSISAGAGRVDIFRDRSLGHAGWKYVFSLATRIPCPLGAVSIRHSVSGAGRDDFYAVVQPGAGGV